MLSKWTILGCRPCQLQRPGRVLRTRYLVPFGSSTVLGLQLSPSARLGAPRISPGRRQTVALWTRASMVAGKRIRRRAVRICIHRRPTRSRARYSYGTADVERSFGCGIPGPHVGRDVFRERCGDNASRHALHVAAITRLTQLPRSFFGITSVQTYIYYQRCRNDPALLKWTVFLLWVLDSLHISFITYAAYTYMTDVEVLLSATITWSIVAVLLVTGFSEFIVRGLFCQRVWRLSNRNIILCLIISVDSLVVLATNTAFSIKSAMISNYMGMGGIDWLLYTCLSASVAADTSIAIALCVLLSKRRGSFSRNTDAMLRTLMMYSINTGALTSMCTIAALATFVASTDTTEGFAVYLMLPKVQLNALLAALNARQALAKHGAPAVVSAQAVPLPLMTSSSTATKSGQSQDHVDDSLNTMCLEIQVQTTTDVKADSMPPSPVAEKVAPFPPVPADHHV